MLGTVAITLLALLGSVALTLSGWGSPVAVAHLAFAVGVLPLIMAAMIHFVPVLTRSGDPPLTIARLPRLAQCVGAFIVASMLGWLPYVGLFVAAAVDLVLVGVLLNWIAARSRGALGTPHPGWRWYGAALGCLMLALLAVIFQGIWPTHWRELKLFHLHLNVLGLVGLAAFGTLPVLLPTVLGQGDPEAAGWLRRRLWLMAGGAMVVAIGSAFSWPLAAPGAALVLVVVLSLLGQWVRRFGGASLLGDGAAVALTAAVVGLLFCLGAGLAHAAQLVAAKPTLHAWAAGFLLPLVSGALSHLLPVWCFPGPQIPARNEMRQHLVWGGQLRAVLAVLACCLLLFDKAAQAGFFVALFMLLLARDIYGAARVLRSTR